MKAKLVYKGGKGSGNFGHAGIPGHLGGSKGKGGGAAESTRGSANREEYTSTAANYLAKQRKKDLGAALKPDEVASLEKAGFTRVPGHNAFIRPIKPSSKNPFDDSFSMVEAYNQKKDWGSPAHRVYTATHFNKDGNRWMDSSEHGYATTNPNRQKYEEFGIEALIRQVDSYQA